MEQDCRRCRYGNTFINTSCQQGEGRKREREQGGWKGEPQDMKIKQEAAANRICLLAKKCNAFQFQFRPLNSFAYLRAAKQEQCALRLCPQLPPARFPLLHHSAQSLHSANMQNLMLAHMKTHAHTRMHTHAEQTHTDIHTGSSHFLSTSLYPSPSAAYCITTHFFRFCCSYKTLISAISLLAKRGRHVGWAWQAGGQALRAPRNCLKIVCKCCTR